MRLGPPNLLLDLDLGVSVWVTLEGSVPTGTMVLLSQLVITKDKDIPEDKG